jgi:hypothetical protein
MNYGNNGHGIGGAKDYKGKKRFDIYEGAKQQGRI